MLSCVVISNMKSNISQNPGSHFSQHNEMKHLKASQTEVCFNICTCLLPVEIWNEPSLLLCWKVHFVCPSEKKKKLFISYATYMNRVEVQVFDRVDNKKDNSVFFRTSFKTEAKQKQIYIFFKKDLDPVFQPSGWSYAKGRKCHWFIYLLSGEQTISVNVDICVYMGRAPFTFTFGKSAFSSIAKRVHCRSVSARGCVCCRKTCPWLLCANVGDVRATAASVRLTQRFLSSWSSSISCQTNMENV